MYNSIVLIVYSQTASCFVYFEYFIKILYIGPITAGYLKQPLPTQIYRKILEERKQ